MSRIGDLPTPSAIVQAAKITLQSSAAVAFPCTRIALGASDFVDIPRGVAPITSYFCRADVQHEGETDVQAKLSSAAPSGATTELEEGKAEAQVEEDDVVNGARDNSFVDLASFSIIEQQRIMRDVEKRRNSTNGVADSLAGCKKRKQQDRGQRGAAVISCPRSGRHVMVHRDVLGRILINYKNRMAALSSASGVVNGVL
eukprot:scaffold1437_cov353-Prasinococcus_capsulatus_cf.AAC.4